MTQIRDQDIEVARLRDEVQEGRCYCPVGPEVDSGAYATADENEDPIPIPPPSPAYSTEAVQPLQRVPEAAFHGRVEYMRATRQARWWPMVFPRPGVSWLVGPDETFQEALESGERVLDEQEEAEIRAHVERATTEGDGEDDVGEEQGAVL
jgi:hypothetical protein